MDTLYLMDEKEMERAKSARLLSIIAIVFSSVYALEGIFSVLFALIPIPILGFFISIILTVIEFCLLIISIIFIVLAFVKKFKLKKELLLFADSPEKQSAESILKTASILSYISVGITSVAFCVLRVLNLVELVLSFI